MITPPPTWETERLAARPPRCQDAQVIFDRYASDAAVAKYMTWRPHVDARETARFLERCEAAWADGSAYPWSLWVKADGEFAGFLEARVRGTAMDVGYALSRRYWRQGLMSEALGALIQWALSQPEIHRVWATCDIENVASARLLEKVGMQQEGILRRWLVHPNLGDAPRDSFCYSVVK